MNARLPGRSMLACQEVFSMLRWLYMSCPAVRGWAGPMLKLRVVWREKRVVRASSIAYLAPVFSCRIVLISKMHYSTRLLIATPIRNEQANSRIRALSFCHGADAFF